MIAQLLGFGASLAIFGWIASIALSEENRESLVRLREAGIGPPALVGLLALLSVVLNGLVFWALVRPVARLSVGWLVAVNAICTLLAYLPFKLSVVARVVLHRRRDHLPYKTLIAWIGASGALTMSTLVVVGALGAVFVEFDLLAWASVGVSLAALSAFTIIGGRLAVETRALHALTLGAGEMLRAPAGVLAAVGLRVADIAAQGARFAITAGALGHSLALGDAAALGSTFYLVGVLAPTGMVGLREGAVFGLGAIALRTGLTESELATLALAVTAVEAVTHLLCGAIAALWLRPARLLRPGAGGGAVSGSDARA